MNNDKKVSFEYEGLFVRVSKKGILVESEGAPVMSLIPHSSVEKLTKEGEAKQWPYFADIDEGEFIFETENRNNKKIYMWTGKSSNWGRKEYRLECDAQGFSFFVTVTGNGAVGKIRYFDGAGMQEQLGSEYNFCEYFVPNYNTDSTKPNYCPSAMAHETYFELLVPPMYCYPFRTAGIATWIGLGLVAKRGNHNYWQFDYSVKDNGFWLSTDMEGHAEGDNGWEAPHIRMLAGEDEFKVLEAYSQYYYATGIAKAYEGVQQHRWWYGPIMCGWIEQFVAPTPKEMPDLGGPYMSAQPVYEDIAQRLEKERKLQPSIIIVDDKWQEFYGTAMPDPKRWPDMRAWVDKVHAKGIRVLLWYKLWGGEGLPEDETYTGRGVKGWNKNDNERYADPTNPKYRARVRQIMHSLLSDEKGCMNCDGFKLDYAFWMGYGRKVQTYGGQSGVELLHSLFQLIYDEAKKVKPDALINASPCHPYFSDLFDQVRLHDYDIACRNMDEVMTRRLRLFNIACPNHSVDTDNSFTGTRYATMRYIRYTPSIGIPDLYQISDPKRMLTESDWDEIRQIWEKYSHEMDMKFAE